MSTPTLAETYDQDFYAWAMKNAELLRTGRLVEIDAENIAEELESMGKSQKRALSSRLAVLLAHLLKWTAQKEQRERYANSWRAAIREQRRRIDKLLQESPSLQPALSAAFAEAYPSAVDQAVAETNLPDGTFPEHCPFALEQALDTDYWPD
jgi:hypothetical protein